MRLQLSSLLSLALAGCAAGGAAPPASPADARLARGLEIAQQHCAACHALGPTGRSAHGRAIAFRDLSRLYPVDALGESLAEGMIAGHPDMPEVTMGPTDIDAFLAWLTSIQRQP
jgi:cytochrome c